jgi:predicted ribosomally synthesized peptide with SipW-like signal peptide
LKKILFSLLVIMVCAGMITSALAYFTDVESSIDNTITVNGIYTPPPLEPGRYYLTNPDSAYGMITIPAGETVLFPVHQSAQTDVVFPEGDWDVVIKTDSDWSGHCSLFIEECTPPGGNLLTNNQADFLMMLSTHSLSFTVRNSYYLGILITNNDILDHTCYVDGGSYLVAPEGSPNYPVPEISSGLLLGLGLAGLAGFIFLKKASVRQKHGSRRDLHDL